MSCDREFLMKEILKELGLGKKKKKKTILETSLLKKWGIKKDRVDFVHGMQTFLIAEIGL